MADQPLGAPGRALTRPGSSFVELIGPFAVSGIGMAVVFPIAAEAVLASVRPQEAGKASGATNAIREVGGVMGVAVLATVFAAHGGYESPQAFTDGVVPALPVAVAVLVAGALLALLTPGRASGSGKILTLDEPEGSIKETAPIPVRAKA